MKRDIFRRGVRMTHKFGEIEGNSDPLGDTFRPQFPIEPQQRSAPVEIQQHGEFRFSPAAGSSAVAKPNGRLASINGPTPDWAGAVAAPIPASTRQRLGTRAKKDKG